MHDNCEAVVVGGIAFYLDHNRKIAQPLVPREKVKIRKKKLNKRVSKIQQNILSNSPSRLTESSQPQSGEKRMTREISQISIDSPNNLESVTSLTRAPTLTLQKL